VFFILCFAATPKESGHGAIETTPRNARFATHALDFWKITFNLENRITLATNTTTTNSQQPTTNNQQPTTTTTNILAFLRDESDPCGEHPTGTEQQKELWRVSGANVTRQTDGSPGNYLLSMLDVQQSRLWVDVWMLLSCLCVCVCNVMKCIVMKCIVLYCNVL